jgi:hypothetical protein
VILAATLLSAVSCERTAPKGDLYPTWLQTRSTLEEIQFLVRLAIDNKIRVESLDSVDDLLQVLDERKLIPLDLSDKAVLVVDGNGKQWKWQVTGSSGTFAVRITANNIAGARDGTIYLVVEVSDGRLASTAIHD